MKKLVNIALILFLSLFLFTKVSYSAVLTKDDIKQKIQQNVVSQLDSKTNGEIVVEIKSIPYDVIKLPDGNIKIKADINLNTVSKYKTAKIEVFVNGKEQKIFFVPFELKIYENVFVVNNFINIGEDINYTNTQIERKDVAGDFNYVLPESFKLNKMRSKRCFKVGDVLDKRFIEIDPDVIKNNIVTINFETGGIYLTIDGKAMENGRIGDYIKVKSDKYNKVYTGQVTAVNQVLIKI